MILTNIFFKLKFSSRYKQIDFFKSNPEAAQSEVFFYLLNRAKNTDWGKRYEYKVMASQVDFRKALNIFQEKVPVSSYDDLSAEIEKILNKKKDVLWPGKTRYLAKSSGTTGSKSKFIPVSDEALSDCHYRGGGDALASYYRSNPETNVFFGKTVSIGGSFDGDYEDPVCGDLSAILMKSLPFWAKPFRSPKISTAILDDWEKKIDKMSRDIIDEDVVALAGVPSWTLLVLRRVLDISGKKNISDLWPNLELFMHGGVSFGPYKKQFKEIISSPKMNYLEIYNASEGFFALNDDLEREDMLLMLDIGVFYEFIPIEDLGEKNPEIVTVSGLKLGRIYALLISTNGGLWRYLIGDTVEIRSVLPVRIKVAGRTKHFINVFGEELMVGNTDKALELALKKNDSIINEYTVCPVFIEGKARGGHEWLIEFEKKPVDLNKFAIDLDESLKSLNSDYEAKRHMDMILSLPKINIARKKLFYDWLKSKGKLGGQNKVPRLSNSRDYLEELLNFNS